MLQSTLRITSRAVVAAAFMAVAVAPTAAGAAAAAGSRQDNLTICKTVIGDRDVGHGGDEFTFYVSGYGSISLGDGECTSIHVRSGRVKIVEEREHGYKLTSIRVRGDDEPRTDIGDRKATVHVERGDHVRVTFVNKLKKDDDKGNPNNGDKGDGDQGNKGNKGNHDKGDKGDGGDD